MKIKVIGTQIYEDYEEKIEKIFDDAVVNISDNIQIIYNDGEILFNKKLNRVEIKNDNNLIIELNEEKVLDYNTPYGIITLKTFGESFVIENNPFKLTIRYIIKLNGTMQYENIVEILET